MRMPIVSSPSTTGISTLGCGVASEATAAGAEDGEEPSFASSARTDVPEAIIPGRASKAAAEMSKEKLAALRGIRTISVKPSPNSSFASNHFLPRFFDGWQRCSTPQKISCQISNRFFQIYLLMTATSSEIHGPELPAMGIVESLDSQDRALLCSYGQFCFLKSGEELIAQGVEQNTLYFVISGELHAKRTDGGREFLMGTIKHGESIGEVAIFDPGAASATVVAVSPSQIWKIDRDALNEFFVAYPEAAVRLAVSLAAVLAVRLRGLASKLEQKVEFEMLAESLGA
jgi:CRP-like cAMP-binding protein